MGLYDRDYMKAGRAARPSLRLSGAGPTRAGRAGPSRARPMRARPRGPGAIVGSLIFWGVVLTVGFLAARYLWSSLIG